ncbi:Peptidase family M28 [Flavobacteriaceae bacterium MAR_2010_188]|nr:Peptidase family M28 [Flavobacteriaceae bacterium MAR_2010_188]
MKKLLFLVGTIGLLGCKSTPSPDKTSTTTTLSTPQTKSQTSVSNSYSVSADDIKKNLSFFASDDLEGREAGSEGIDKAATYIEDYLKTVGVKPYFESYRDNFMLNDLNTFNVVGVVEGSDPQLKNEYIVIGAHYDHIGVMKGQVGDSIANGANDNASGTSTIMEIAKYFGTKQTNKRSIIFAFFSAEEKGLKGSQHLAEELKKKNIELYTMLNFEMTGVPFVGRDYVAFITGYELSNLAEKMNSYAGDNFIGMSDVSKKYNLFMRSDNYAFYQAFKTPCHTISTCDLTNFDEYHKAGDEVQLMDFSHMAKLTNKVIPVIERMANTPTEEIKMNE